MEWNVSASHLVERLKAGRHICKTAIAQHIATGQFLVNISKCYYLVLFLFIYLSTYGKKGLLMIN